MQRQIYQKDREVMVPFPVFHVFAQHPLDGHCSSDFNCMVCDGGLALCLVCGLGEGELTSECPGYPAQHLGDHTYAKKLDFKHGRWFRTAAGPPPPSPNPMDC